MANSRIVMEEGRLYHIYNHACGDEDFFRSAENYFFFMKRYQRYVDPIAETYAYCLMPNHFHLLVRMKEMNRIGNKKLLPIKNNTPDYVFSFSLLFNSFAKAYNAQYQRRGSLFVHSFNRIQVDSDEYLRKLIIYIHRNPVNHGFVDHPWQWEFSSYNRILAGKPYWLQAKRVIEIFYDTENFVFNHQSAVSLDDELTLEKDF